MGSRPAVKPGVRSKERSPSEGGPIVLATDFGTADGFVGVMKGVMLGINPAARIVDLANDLQPQDIRAAAFVLWTTCRYFPPSSVFVTVVDPGVGGPRRGIAVETPLGTFVGPDNGAFTWVLDEIAPCEVRAVELANSQLWLPTTSATFHGRDVFAPVAAHLSLGATLESLGPPVVGLVRLELPRPTRLKDGVEGEVLRIDRFGNLVTNLQLEHVEHLGDITLALRGVEIAGLRPYYAAGTGLGAVVGSAGLIEIALTDGSAAASLGAGVGDKVRVRRRGATTP